MASTPISKKMLGVGNLTPAEEVDQAGPQLSQSSVCTKAAGGVRIQAPPVVETTDYPKCDVEAPRGEGEVKSMYCTNDFVFVEGLDDYLLDGPIETCEVEAPQKSGGNDPPAPKPSPPLLGRRSGSLGAIPKVPKFDTEQSEMRKSKHTRKADLFREEWGNHTVKAQSVIDVQLHREEVDVTQNVCTRARLKLQQVGDHVVYHHQAWHLATNVAGPPGDRPVNGRPSSEFLRFVPAVHIVSEFHIMETAPIVLGEVDVQDCPHLMMDGVLQYKKAVDALRASIDGLSPQMADSLAAHLLDVGQVFDNSTFFTMAYMMFFILYDFEMQGVAPVRPDAGMEDVFTFCNLAAGQQTFAEQTQVFTQIIGTQRVTFDYPRMSPADINLLRLIARGPISIVAPQAAGVRHIAQTMRRVVLDISFLTRVQNVELPEFAMPSAGQALASIKKMAVLMGSHDSMVKGFVRASLLLTGNMAQLLQAPPAVNRWVNGLLEIERTAMPAVRTPNLLWANLPGGLPPFDRTSAFVDDYATLASSSPVTTARISVVVASWVSLAFSTLLNHFNLTGRELTSMLHQPGLHENAADLVASMLVRHAEPTPPAISITAAIVRQLTEATLSPTVYRGCRWCNELVGLDPAHFGQNMAWMAGWPFAVPYLVLPLAASASLRGYAHVWGLSESPVTFDFSQELQTAGPIATRGWYGYLGEGGYMEKAQSGMPFIYEPYGILAINALIQHYGVPLPAHIGHQYIRAAHRACVVEPVPLINVAQPVIEGHLRYIMPGTLPTFDWATKRVVSPYITRQAMGAQVFDSLMIGASGPSPNAGINRPGMNMQVNPVLSIDRVLANLGLGSASASSTVAPDQGN